MLKHFLGGGSGTYEGTLVPTSEEGGAVEVDGALACSWVACTSGYAERLEGFEVHPRTDVFAFHGQ